MGTANMKLKYGTDITTLAAMGKLDPVIGREREKELLIEALLKRHHGNACLVGDPGVGKTAIVHALAIKIASNSLPRQLKRKAIYSVKMDGLVDGENQPGGELEERVRVVLEEVRSGCMILFIDGLHNFIKDDRRDEVFSILKLALANDDFKCIIAIRVDDYSKYIERDEAIKSMLEIIQLREPSRHECIKILQGIIPKYQNHHGVKFDQATLISAIDSSKNYMRGGVLVLPGKAINLLDKAGARAQKLGKTHVSEAEIEHVVSTCRGRGSTFAACCVLGFEEKMKLSIIGQDNAVEAVCRAIRRAYVGTRDETKPIGSFLFTGPTGVGKTEIAKVVARDYFGSEAALVRIDMCQFMESERVPRLTDLLMEEVRTRTHCVVLLEEIEKAHQKALNVLLQILDHGRLGGYGYVNFKGVDFSNTILILTSNEECKLKPEVVNRFDEVVVLKPLEEDHVEKIFDIMIDEFRGRVDAKRKIQVKVSKGLKECLIRVGYDKSFGAPSLKRAIINYVETRLADEYLRGGIHKNQTVLMDVTQTGRVLCHSVNIDQDSEYCP